MRFWFSGPRILGGLVRPGVSFGPADWRAAGLSATQLEHARKAVRQQAIARGMEVPPDAAIDAWIKAEADRLRHPMGLSIAWGIVEMIVAVPLAVLAIFCIWVIVMLVQQLH